MRACLAASGGLCIIVASAVIKVGESKLKSEIVGSLDMCVHKDEKIPKPVMEIECKSKREELKETKR